VDLIGRYFRSLLEASDVRHASVLWPARELTAQYKALHKALTTHLKLLHRMPREQALRETLLLGRTTVSQLVRDPMLPPELMSPAPRDALIAKLQAYKRGAHDVWIRWMSNQTLHDSSTVV
jgi:phenylacetic acid degradation operon negative regulatory protein